MASFLWLLLIIPPFHLHKSQSLISSQLDLHNLEDILDSHPVFPKWLTNREDFQLYFHEWGSKDIGPQDDYMIEHACQLNGHERKPADIQILVKWMKRNKILQHVRQNRLMEVCRNLELLECPSGTRVISQGEPGDAFYLVVSGKLNVLLDGMVVNTLKSGHSFGEKALENDAPRSASIITITPSKLLVLRAYDYKSMVASAQAKTNEEMVISRWRYFINFQSI